VENILARGQPTVSGTVTGLFERPSQVRLVVGGLIVAGGVALAGFTVLRRPLMGVGVYGLAVVGAAAAQSRTDATVFDERDETVSREAARWTLTLFGFVSAGVFPALTVAWGLDLFEWQPWSTAIALFVAVLYLTYGTFFVALGRRR
jgi:uncharacterized membrane protein